MKKAVDQFSRQAKVYKKYRPSYPPELYQLLLQAVPHRERCWDCGTGNGQVAVVLAEHFERVDATDISQQQLNQAPQKANIHYQVERAEQTRFADHQFDLITVAQAIHWFDFAAFYREVRRVAKPDGRIAIWGYGLLRIEATIDALIQQFYTEIVGPYWKPERRHIDQQYTSIEFDFSLIPMPDDLTIEINWSLEDIKGYFNSWSSVQNYRAQHGRNPVDWIIERLAKHWAPEEQKTVHFPIFIRMGTMD
ncbi:MAG: class I SAM-dependent methyltransferase [Bacteroidota bacterium]